MYESVEGRVGWMVVCGIGVRRYKCTFTGIEHVITVYVKK